MSENKMKVEIWSDIMCPFCYIGKRRFETALQNFSQKDNIEIEWKSFQLMPTFETKPDRSLNEFLAEEKGISVQQASEMNNQISHMAKHAGLNYNLDKTIPANTFKSHKLIQFAKKFGKQNEIEEILFYSYFTEGRNIDDNSTLIELGKQIGLGEEELRFALESDDYIKGINSDINEAQSLGIRGVPFFVFNGKHAVSGAQESSTFMNALEKSYHVWEKDSQTNVLDIIDGATCDIEGKCE